MEHAEGLPARLRTFLGVNALPTSPSVHLVSEARCDGFTRQRVDLVGQDGQSIPAFLAVPDGEGPFPAVVVFHQHAGQRHFGKSEVFGLVGDPHQGFAPPLVRAGFVVLAPDSLAFEDRRPNALGTDPHDGDWEQHYNAMAFPLVLGDTLMRQVLTDALTCVSALAGHRSVDPARVGALGHSYGGNTVMFLAAIDPRVAFACSSGAVCSYRNKLAKGTAIEMAEVIPGFAAHFDAENLLEAMVPRHFLIVSSSDDPYSADADDVAARARGAFEAASVEQHLEHLRVMGPHALDSVRFNFILQWLVKRAALGAPGQGL